MYENTQRRIEMLEEAALRAKTDREYDKIQQQIAYLETNSGCDHFDDFY